MLLKQINLQKDTPEKCYIKSVTNLSLTLTPPPPKTTLASTGACFGPNPSEPAHHPSPGAELLQGLAPKQPFSLRHFLAGPGRNELFLPLQVLCALSSYSVATTGKPGFHDSWGRGGGWNRSTRGWGPGGQDKGLFIAFMPRT